MLGIAITIVVCIALVSTMICMRNAKEVDEDAVLFPHLDGFSREIKKPDLEKDKK